MGETSKIIMAEGNLNLKQTVSPQLTTRTVLLGRLKMAQAIKLPESEWAKMLSDVEKDPLFQEMVGAKNQGQQIITFRRYGRSGIATQFYEMQDADVVGNSVESPETLLDEKKHLLQLIEKIGQENFEKYFLYREEAGNLDNISSICGVSIEEAKQMADFILDMSVQAEFFHPSNIQSPNTVKPTLIGRIIRNDDGTFSISYYSPHLARGMYEINRNALRRWQKDKHLGRTEAARVRKYIGILELSNLKQGAFWRVINYMLEVQREYLETRNPTKMAPISLRAVARHLKFAPSTISRVLALKSVLLPWEEEVLVIHLMPGQRKVVLSLLEKIMNEENHPATDAQLAQKLEVEHGIKVSRRTITACRHIIASQNK